MSVITDGSGKCFSAKVDEDNRLHTLSTTRTREVDSTLRGDTYYFSTGKVQITGANESWLLYFKNTDTKDWVIESFTGVFSSSSTHSPSRNPSVSVVDKTSTCMYG